jgi:hypothetical protein
MPLQQCRDDVTFNWPRVNKAILYRRKTRQSFECQNPNSSCDVKSNTSVPSHKKENSLRYIYTDSASAGALTASYSRHHFYVSPDG